MKDVRIVDIETFKEYTLFSFYHPDKDRWAEFSINKWTNQIDGFVKYMTSIGDSYLVFYNGLRFDSQVMEFVLRNYEKWHEKSSLEICSIIYQKAQDTIHDSNYEIFPEYREFQLSFKVIDLFEVHHYSNKNRLVSLKRLEFEMDMESIEELPIFHGKENLTQEEVEEIRSYCRNDIKATYQFWLISLGETDHPLYKGNNQIQFRLDILEEFKIPCMNYSNAKIGDEIIKKYYCEAKGITYKQLPKKGFFRKQIEMRHCISKVISFKTKLLQDFLKDTKKVILQREEDFIKTITFYGQDYTFAKGGLHNVIKGKIYESDDEIDLVDIDVSGFYPWNIINNSYHPYHLGKEFLVGYEKPYFKRIELKPLAKKDKKIKGIVGGLKEAGNCPYGKSGEMDSWLYDKQMTIATCVTGEFMLLMLIEECELNGIRSIMANTDGATFLVPKAKYEIFTKIKEEWCDKVTIRVKPELEEVKYEKMVFATVNDYLAIKQDKGEDRIKLKGDFMKDFELHKNKSKKIIPIALEKYYVDNIPISETIKNHKNIYDFCIRQKSSRNFHYEGISKEGTNIYKKLIRYYVSKEGEKLFKIKNPECTTDAPDVSIVEKGEICKICNKLPKNTDPILAGVDFDYYITMTQEFIDKVKLSGRKAVKKQPPNQTTLW